MPYVTERWLGGMLTNWSTMYQRIQELERMEKLVSSGEVERLTKKEGLLIHREITRLHIRLSGVRSITRVPNMIFVVDVMREESAVHEANLLKIPVVALVDTNCDPSHVDYVIPSNDDAIRAIKLLVAKMADAVLEGKAMRKDEELETMEQVKAEVQAISDADRKPAQRLDLDEEMNDEQLLGDATLAKLTPVHPEPVKPEPIVEIEKPAVSEEPVVEPVVEAEGEPEAGPTTEPAGEPSTEPTADPSADEEKTGKE
jgi:small subunit ribosomal protein S2